MHSMFMQANEPAPEAEVPLQVHHIFPVLVESLYHLPICQGGTGNTGSE